jgi:hypothetical protein
LLRVNVVLELWVHALSEDQSDKVEQTGEELEKYSRVEAKRKRGFL